MKKLFLSIVTIMLLVLLTSCTKVGQNVFNQSRLEGNLKAFNLKSPTNGETVRKIPTFSWEASENAETYILEVASSTAFSQQEDVIYVKKSGISETTYNLFANLKYKNYTYYWRVTAVNKGSKKVCNEVFSFFYEANIDEEVEYTIDHADEWEVHKDGSPVNVSVDNTNFFNNDKKALKIDFTHEIMNSTNDITHDGWAVVTHQQEEELYGVDAFYFDFYYSGQDSSIWFRAIDEDNEYYNAEIKVANNVKQRVIIKFDEFTLRTKGGTPIMNQKFDYNMIKYVEFVFEKTFGDGVCYVSDIKAINFDKYKYLFIEQVDFNEIDSDDITTDTYNFSRDYSDDGTEFTMSYSSDIKGYGFTKFNINKFVEAKDAVKIKVDFQGSNSANVLFRIIEEDKDRWVYKQPVSSIPDDGIIVIPYNAFTLSEYNGNGAREFYFIKQIQFGIENVYETGSIKFSNVKFVNLEDEKDHLFEAEVGSDGLIENFDNYSANAELYYKWIITNQNKDEAIATNKTYQMGNSLCGELSYKSDMFGAGYGLKFINEIADDYTSISFKALDKTVKYAGNDDYKFSHLDTVTAKLQVHLYTAEHEYKYVIEALSGDWTSYDILLSDFVQVKEYEEEEDAELKSKDIKGFGLELSYFYYLENGKAEPVYTSNNKVYFDDIYFTRKTETKHESVYHKIETDPDTKISMIDNFDDYESNEEILLNWSMDETKTYSKLSLGEYAQNDKTLIMQYKTSQPSPSYQIPTIFSATATAKAIMLDIKGDGQSTFYINISITQGGNKYKLRHIIQTLDEGWTRYTIGFDSANFSVEEGGTYTLTASKVQYITRISFGIVNWKDQTYALKNIEINNLCLIDGVSYAVYTKEGLGD